MNSGQWLSLALIALGLLAFLWVALRALIRPKPTPAHQITSANSLHDLDELAAPTHTRGHTTRSTADWPAHEDADESQLAAHAPATTIEPTPQSPDPHWTSVVGQLRHTNQHERPDSPLHPPPASPSRPATPSLTHDMQALTRELLDELDAKVRRLELLIVQADDRIRRLELKGAGWNEAELNASATDVETQRGSITRVVLKTESTDPVTRQIYDLADAGKDTLSIARETGQATGKIELILALRGR